MDEEKAKGDDDKYTSDSEENVKRLKTNESEEGKTEENPAASTSREKQLHRLLSGGNGDGLVPHAVTFKTPQNSKNRNYRRSRDSQDGPNSDSVDIDDPMGEPEEPAQRQIETAATDDDNDNDWEDYEEENDHSNNSNSDSSDEDTNIFSDNSDSNSTVTHDTENEADIEDHPLFKKEKPKHNWFVVNELEKRQLGSSAKLQSREMFQQKCYGSLHCVQRLELMYKLEEHSGCVNSLAFHPDGTLLASGADDLKVVIWDWKVGKSLIKYKTKHKGNVFQSKFLHLSGDLHVVTCARDGQVRLAQLSREEGIRSARLLGSHKGPCHKLIVLPEQPQIILSVGEDAVILNHDVRGPKSSKITTVKEDDREVALYSIHGNPLKSHEFVVSGRDSIVRIYDQRKCSKTLNTFSPFKKNKSKGYRNYHVTCAVYNHDGSEVLATYSDSDVYLFDVNEQEHGQFIHQYQGHRNGATIKGVNFFGPKSEFIVSGSDCGHIYFWERNTEALVQWLLADDNGVVNCLEPHPQLPYICTSGLDWDVKVWVPSCEEEPTMKGLSTTVRNNLKTKADVVGASDINESQMLWMLWRHLRYTSRLRASNVLNVREFMHTYSDSNSSDTDSPTTNEDSDEDFDRAPSCRTS